MGIWIGVGVWVDWGGVGLTYEGELDWEYGWGLKTTAFSVLQASYSVSYL